MALISRILSLALAVPFFFSFVSYCQMEIRTEAMDSSTKPDSSEQAPELSPREHDDGPIVAATYSTHDRYEFTPEQQREKLDRAHSGFTPVQPYPPQYQYQHSVEPSAASVAPAPSEKLEKKQKRWVGWTIGLVVGILAALGAGIGIGYAIGENVSHTSSPADANDNAKYNLSLTPKSPHRTSLTSSLLVPQQ